MRVASVGLSTTDPWADNHGDVLSSLRECVKMRIPMRTRRNRTSLYQNMKSIASDLSTSGPHHKSLTFKIRETIS